MFKTGKQAGIKEILTGYDKVSKDSVVATPIIIERVVKGTSAEYGEFVFILGDQNGKKVFVPCPAASKEIFADWSVSDDELMETGQYKLYMEKLISRNNRDYYICYIDE